jgi:hypothetical protein
MASEELVSSRMLNATFSPSQVIDYNFEDAPTEEGFSDVVWMLMWFLSLVAFLCCPFCGTAKRRELCKRRIRERRWIEDDELEEELDREAARRQQARHQHLHDRQRRFQVSRTQEDEIREQFLTIVTEKYTTVSQAVPLCQAVSVRSFFLVIILICMPAFASKNT